MNSLISILAALPALMMAKPASADCPADYSVIGARYDVSTIQPHTGTKTIRHIVLWRNGDRVAHEYSDTRITEIFERTSNGKLRLERHFDDFKRGIEYQPNEIRNRGDADDWNLTYQLVADNLLASMHLEASAGSGCDTVKTFSLTKDTATIELDWLANQQLLQRYTEIAPDRRVTWKLVATITDPERIRNAFAARADYDMTDYADIGDNESDPFLMRMINTGFVEHGASGFYDAHGHQLEGHHTH